MMMLQNSLLMGGRVDSHDHFSDWRLDVDNMSYEVCCFSLQNISIFNLIYLFIYFFWFA